MIRMLIRALFGSGYAKGGYTPAGSAEHKRMLETAHYTPIAKEETPRARH